MPGWAIWLGQGNGFLNGVAFAMATTRWNKAPWVVTIRRIHYVNFAPAVVFRAEFNDPGEAAALAAHLDRELAAGRLPAQIS